MKRKRLSSTYKTQLSKISIIYRHCVRHAHHVPFSITIILGKCAQYSTPSVAVCFGKLPVSISKFVKNVSSSSKCPKFLWKQYNWRVHHFEKKISAWNKKLRFYRDLNSDRWIQSWTRQLYCFHRNLGHFELDDTFFTNLLILL
jgi:hypothetical protein